jgi:hypothetical protein
MSKTLTGSPFQPSRDDGRSDRRVVYDLTHDAEPGMTFTYKELIEALEEGLDTPVARDRVYRAVGAANTTLLREHRRYLGVVENVGYRVIHSEEHLPVSLQKKDRAQSYLKRGIELLRHARLDELTQAQRTLHEGQLMILSGIHSAVQDSARRLDRTESLIEDLLKSDQQIQERLDRLEGPQAAADDDRDVESA